ncbi:MAG: four-helix bundle copper-binding protein [Chloroflexi bacterium]|nr:four-helix bundle copper-binding protein [Chloroflexota bacterium]
MENEFGNAMDNCIAECQDCHDICTQTVMHCLEAGGEQATPDHLGFLLDCAEICQTSANFMLRESALHGRTCNVCAEACERCAQSCRRFPDDDIMQVCADSCYSCAQSCREMAAMEGG